MIFQGYFTRHHSEHSLRQSNELFVTYTGTNYPWPVLSSSGSSITTDYSNNEILIDSGTSEVATLNIGASYNATTFSYSMVVYFRSFIHTHSGNHSLTFAGDNCYSSSISTDDTDLTLGGNTLTFSGTDNGFHHFTVNFTKNQDLGCGNYDFYQELHYTFTLTENTDLSSPAGAVSGPFVVTGNIYYKLPRIFLVALGCVSSSDTVTLSDSTLCEHYDKGDNLHFTLFSVGNATAELIFCYDVSATIQYGSIALMPYSGTGVNVGATRYNAVICNGHHRAEMNMSITNNHLNTGRSHYTLDEPYVELGGTDISSLVTYPTITLRDNSANHILHFSTGFGSNTAQSVTDLTSDCESQKPSNYSITPGTYGANASNLLMNINVTTNSIPYWTCTGNNGGFRVHFIYIGNNTAADDGDHNVILCPGDDIYVYDNVELTGSNNVHYISIDHCNWSSGRTLYIQQGATAYKYITLKYYVTNLSNNSNLNSDIDYSGLTDSGSPVTVVNYDYSTAPTDVANYRSLNLGAWNFTVGALGELNIRYIGAEQGQNTTTNFTLPPSTTNVSYPIVYGSP